MSYSTLNGSVAWRGTPIPSSTADGFDVLHPIIARTDACIYVLGKPFAADPASFEVLGECYARDNTAVFLIQQIKLKPIPNADPATFRVLGRNHGVDKSMARYKDKKIATPLGANLSAMRSLSDHLCTDGRRLYHGTQSVAMATRAGIDWSRARLHLLGPDDGINLPPHAVADPIVRYYGAAGLDGYCLLEGAQFETLYSLPPTVGRSANYVSDGVTLWYRGTPLKGAQNAKDAKAITGNLLEAAGQTFHRDTPTPYPSGTFVQGPPKVAGISAVLSSEGLWDAPGHKGGPLTLCARRADQPKPDLCAVMTRIVACAQVMLDGATDRLADSDAQAIYAAALDKAPKLTAACTPQGISLRLEDGSTFVEPAQRWWTLAMKLRLYQTKDTGHLLSRTTSNWLPRGTETQEKVMQLLWGDFCSLLPDLYDVAPEDARVLAFTLFQVAPNHWRSAQPSEPFHGPLSAVPLDLIPLSHWSPRTKDVTRTTNLGVLKLMLRPDWIAHPDWRHRIDAILRLHSVIHDTPKLAKIAGETFEALKDRHGSEPVPYIVQQIEMTIQMIAYSADRLPKQGTMEPLRASVFDWLIANGVNVADNSAAKARMERGG